MVTKALDIFVASSGELASDRIAIGNIIRGISQRSELTHGIAVRMRCWEDYDPTYNGKPSQKRYNIDLVGTSQVMLALFHTICGKYTQEEISEAKAKGMPIEYLQKTSGKVSTDLSAYLADNAINPTQYSTRAQLETLILSIVEKYTHLAVDVPDKPHLRQQYMATLVDMTAQTTSKEIDNTVPYATVDNIGNIIRQLDDLGRSADIGRLRLVDASTTEPVHHLLACIHSTVDLSAEKTLTTARDKCKDPGDSLQNLSVYFYREESGVPEQANRYYRKLMDDPDWAYFAVTYSHTDTIKLNLLRLMIDSDVNSASDFSVSNLVLNYKKQPLASVVNLGFLDGDTLQISNLARQIEKLRKKPQTQDIKFQLERLDSQVDYLCGVAISAWLNIGRFQLDRLNEANNQLSRLTDEGRYDEVVSLTDSDADIPALVAEYQAAEQMVRQTHENLLQRVRTIEYRVTALVRQGVFRNAEKIIQSYDDILQLLQPLAPADAEARHTMLRYCYTLCRMVENGVSAVNFDRYYEQIISLLETYPDLMERVGSDGYLAALGNLLNGYGTNHNWEAGDNLIKKILIKLDEYKDGFDEETRLQTCLHLYRCISVFEGNKDNYAESGHYAGKALESAESLSRLSSYTYTSHQLAVYMTMLINAMYLDDIDTIQYLMPKCEDVIETVDSGEYQRDDNWECEVATYYRTAASVYYEIEGMEDREKSEAMFDKAFGILAAHPDYFGRHYSKYLSLKSELYHNRGFMRMIFDDFKTPAGCKRIVEDYTNALEIRRELAGHNSAKLDEVARTLVNFANYYRTIKEFDKARQLASEALHIYRNQHVSGVLSTEEHTVQAQLMLYTIDRDDAYESRDRASFDAAAANIHNLVRWTEANSTKAIPYRSVIRSEWLQTLLLKSNW